MPEVAMYRIRHIALFMVVALFLAACQEASPGSTSTPDAAPAPVSSAGPTASSLPAADPLGERLDWFIEVLEAGTVDEAVYSGTFTAEFLENVPYKDFEGALGQMAQLGTSWSIGEFEERQDSDATVLISSEQGEQIRVVISLEQTVPYRIQGLLIQPAEPPALDDPPVDIESAADRLDELGSTELMVAEVSDGSCQAVYETGDGSAVPVGSAIKLYVLAAVAQDIGENRLAWDDDVAIQDSLKSIPTGVLQDEDEGTEFSVREMSEAMIALSDNTATDHLIDLVGREMVEDALAEYGMAEPGLNIPFLNTLELSALKVGPASGLATQWIGGDEAARRGILNQISDITPADIPLAEFSRPIHVDEIEWFATPADICRVMVDLYDMGDPLTKILTINPGLPDEDQEFAAIAFKGGSEPGLISMNWLVERTDGRRFVVAGSVVNASEDLDQLEATLLFGAIRDLVADLP